MRNVIGCFLLSGLALTMVGCSSSGEISDITKSSVKSVLASAQGLISGSQQNVKVSGYTVSASVGAWAGGAIAQTTSGGYKVYSTVQGSLSSETAVTVQQ